MARKAKKYTSTYRVPDEIRNQPIEWLQTYGQYRMKDEEKIMAQLRKFKCVTIEDVIAHKRDISEKYMTEIKVKMIFNI